MTRRHYLGLVLCVGGSIFVLSLLVNYLWRAEPEKVDTRKLLATLVQQDTHPFEMSLPSMDYPKKLNGGLWGFERIKRRNNRISTGYYTQLCQNKADILRQVHFWLNAPVTFINQYPQSNFVAIEPSQVSPDKIQHYFAMDSLEQTQSGLKFTRHEVQIVWAQAEDQYELRLREARGHYMLYGTDDPLSWLMRVRSELQDHPLIAQGLYDEQKMIAFRAEDCN